MNIIKIIESARKLSDKQVDLMERYINVQQIHTIQMY